MSATTNKTNKLRVAVVQAAPVCFNLDASLLKLAQLCKGAAENGAKFVMFPEAFLSAYPKGSVFGAMSEYYGDKADEGREKYRMYWESSVQIPGPAIDQLSTVAKENRVYLVVGVIERDGGTLYCTAVHFDEHGNFLGKHRKLMPTFNERLVWGMGDGSTIPIFNTPIGKFGSVICWENYMPLMRLTMFSKGIQIYCAPNADGTEEWNATVRHIALEGRCFVLSCNQFTRKSDYPKGFLDTEFDHQHTATSKDPNYIVSHGGSCIANPLGKFLAAPLYDAEGTLYADLDLNDCIRGKLEFDVVGHYSRPDIFKLHVNTKPNVSVQYNTVPEIENASVHAHAHGDAGDKEHEI
jgi:nitrilase